MYVYVYIFLDIYISPLFVYRTCSYEGVMFCAQMRHVTGTRAPSVIFIHIIMI